ncbi:MAG: diphthamide biosynthesis enzyme Dph2 [Candidatus Micrarchaeota archaeon]|nr:diphthamide biosynthesis enzyme Dph2 [Candidatus Micrarchaeota archaeon]
MRIILQFPEGLKAKAIEEAKKLSMEGHEVFVSASACFGGCDVCVDEARHIKADKIIHFGHAEFSKVKTSIQIEYRPYFLDIDWVKFQKAIAKALELLAKVGAKKVALVFPIQHLNNAKVLKKKLEVEGIQVVMKKGGPHVKQPGQILGCDTQAAMVEGVDTVIYFGGGKFHPTGIVGKRVICLDPHLNDAYDITGEIERLERKKKAALIAASQAKTFGVLISTKSGQMNLAAAVLAKRMLEKKGRTAVLLVANEFSPISLANFMSFEAYINTACPRIDEDTEAYGKPIVNVSDLKKLLELMS